MYCKLYLDSKATATKWYVKKLIVAFVTGVGKYYLRNNSEHCNSASRFSIFANLRRSAGFLQMFADMCRSAGFLQIFADMRRFEAK